jgi:hypothetical protein
MNIKLDGERLIDTYYKAIMDASDKCFKGFAFLLTINAVLLGYIINSKIAEPQNFRYKVEIVWSGIILNFLYALCNILLYIFILSVYKTYSTLTSRINQDDKAISQMVVRDVKRGRTVYHFTFLAMISVAMLLIIFYWKLF